ncbi:GNAT family N-acetyltransferase [Tropicibacter sp. S64]|uniref:GNAT family N-acetyltransferase n=1 Tax=Tropicibacter sp. S64 TaxID=3415122 RepID=UPI003C7D701C
MLRWAKTGDYDVLGRLMFDAIHATPSPYTPAQRRAWLSEAHAGSRWAARLAAQRVAVLDTGRPQGFATLRADGYVDMIFLAPQLRNQGHFRRLMTMLIEDARRQKMPELTTHASLAAQGPFLSMGFEVIRHETVSRDGQSLSRAHMRKTLGPLPAALLPQAEAQRPEHT